MTDQIDVTKLSDAELMRLIGPVTNADTGESLNHDQTLAYRQLQAAGGIDPNAEPGSPRLPRAVVPGSGKPEPGSFFVDQQGQVHQAPKDFGGRFKDAMHGQINDFVSLAEPFARSALLNAGQPAKFLSELPHLADGPSRAFARGVPIAGAFADEANAATLATVAPALEPLLRHAPRPIQDMVGYDQRAEIGGGKTWHDRYNQAIDLQKFTDDQFDQHHPFSSTGLQGAGAVAGGVAALPVLGAGSAAIDAYAPMLGTVPRAVVSGLEAAGVGAAHGYGLGHGGWDDPSRSGGAIAGGLVGGGLGVGAPVVGTLAKAGIGGVSKLADAMRGAKVTVGDAAPGGGSSLQPALRAGLPQNLDGSTKRLVDTLSAIEASPPIKVAPTDARGAYDRLFRALQRQGMTPEAATAEAKRLGPFGMVADTGDSTRELGRAVMNLPGPGAAQGGKALKLRQEGIKEDGEFLVRPASGRIADRAAGGLGVAGKQYHAELDHLSTAQRAAAGPAYAKMEAAAPIPSSELAAFRASPDFDKAYARARTISQRPTEQADGTLTVNALPDEIPESLDWRTLNLIKQGYDDLVSNTAREGIGASEQGSIKNTAKLFVKKLDSLNPDFKPARDAFAGPARLMDAQEAGRAFMKEDSPVLAASLADMSASEQQAYRLGAVQQLRDKLGSKPTTYDAARGLLTPNQLGRFRALFPDREGFARFANMLADEKTMFDTRHALIGNSTTAKQQEALRDVGENPVGDLLDTAIKVKVSPLAAAMKLVNGSLAAGNGQRMNQPTSEALAAALFGMDKRALPGVLEGLTEAQKRAALADALKVGGRATPSGAGVGAATMTQRTE